MSQQRKPRLNRDAISRARFFLRLARECPYSADLSDREEFESYLDAAIVFGRAALHRVKGAAEEKAQGDPDMKRDLKEWWDGLLKDPATLFFRDERNQLLKEGPIMVGQIVRLPSVFGNDPPTNIEPGPPLKAEELYYYEDPKIPATVTVERHLESMAKTIADADDRFGTRTLQGRR